VLIKVTALSVKKVVVIVIKVTAMSVKKVVVIVIKVIALSVKKVVVIVNKVIFIVNNTTAFIKLNSDYVCLHIPLEEFYSERSIFEY
jgi:hypothetical protein